MIISDDKFVPLLPYAPNDSSAATDHNSSNNYSINLTAAPSSPIVALPEQLPFPIVLILSVPAMLIILLTIFGNLLVLFFKARVGRTNTTLLVWNLGLTDFMVGILVLPMGAYYLLNRRWIFGPMLCRIWVGADVTFCTCSVVTICIISVDRYLAVTRPLRYKSVVTKLKVIVVIVLIWSFSLGILLATVRWESHQHTVENKTCYVGDEIRYLAHSVVFAFFLPASVTLTLYWRIYSLARNRQRALDRGFLMILGHNMNFLTNTLSQTTALRVHIGKNNGMVEHQRRVLRTHERIAKTLGVVSCSFLFCWLPFFTLYLLNFQCEGCVPPLAIDIASWLGYCNSMLNPIIYSFTVKEFKRSAFRAVLPIWRCVHGWCPRVVRKPPDARTIHRIGRKRQQISATQQQQQQQHRVPPLSTMCKNATGPNATAALGADGRKRRIPSRERLSRARTGAIASLMVNTNCSIMQNAMTVELVHNNNNKRSTRVKKNAVDGGGQKGEEEADDDGNKMPKNDDGDGRKQSKTVVLNGSATAALAEQRDGTKRIAAVDQQQPKRSMIMLGENLNKMAQKFARRRSSLDEQDTRKHSDSGGELFNRSGLVTTTLLLATSNSLCGEEQLRHEEYNGETMMCNNNNNNNFYHGIRQAVVPQHENVAKRSASTTGGGERTGSLPMSTSFSSSEDSDLTAEHSQYSVRMPCKLPVKKWQKEKQQQRGGRGRRRHSMHGIPSKGSNSAEQQKIAPAASTAEEGKKCGKKCGDGGGAQNVQQQQRQGHSRKAPLLFAAFKRMKAADGGDSELRATSSTPITQTQNVGLWQRARAMASTKRRHLIGLSGSNSLGSISGRKNEKGRRKQRSAAKEEEEENSSDNRRTTPDSKTTTAVTRELVTGREQQRGKGGRETTTTTTVTDIETTTPTKEIVVVGESAKGERKREERENSSGSPTERRREVRKEKCQQQQQQHIRNSEGDCSSDRLLDNTREHGEEDGKRIIVRGTEEETVMRIFYVTDETPL